MNSLLPALKRPTALSLAIALAITAALLTGAAPTAADTQATPAKPLTLELFAPIYCEGPEYELSWRVSGGTAPYRVYLLSGRQSGEAEGRIQMPCNIRESAASRAGWIGRLGCVRDANGRFATARVHTYPIYAWGYGAFCTEQLEQKSIRMVSWVVTLPAGLRFCGPVDGTTAMCGPLDRCELGSVITTCHENGWCDAQSACLAEWDFDVDGCRGSDRYYADGWSVSLLDLGRFTDYEIDGDLLADDPDIEAETRAEAEALLDSLIASQFEGPPEPPSWAIINPEPLSLRYWEDPPSCRMNLDGSVTASLFVEEQGGSWTPTTVRINHEPVRYFYFGGLLRLLIDCTPQDLHVISVRDSFAAGYAPRYAWSTYSTLYGEVGFENNFSSSKRLQSPSSSEHGELQLLVRLLQGESEVESWWCEPGSVLTTRIEAVGGVPPYRLHLTGKPEVYLEEHEGRFVGEYEVGCPEQPGGTELRVDVYDSSADRFPARVRVERPITAIAEHPSGLGWDELRRLDRVRTVDLRAE